MVHNETHTEWNKIQAHILQFEDEGLVSRTFRRLDPERQRAIILAILDEAAEKGPTQVSIKAVADRAAAAVGSLYTYFPNRDGMLDFAVKLVTRFMLEEMASFRPFLVSLPLREGLKMYLNGRRRVEPAIFRLRPALRQGSLPGRPRAANPAGPTRRRPAARDCQGDAYTGHRTR